MKRTFSLTAAAILAAGLLAGAAQAAEKLVFAWTPNPQTPQVEIALERGFFKEAGIDIQLVAFATGREGFEALIGGQVDITFMAEFPAAVGLLRGRKFGIIGDLARFRGSRIIASAKRTPLRSASDLGGLKIGTTRGTNVDFFLSQVLNEAGVKAEIVNASPGDLVPALARGDIAAAAMFPTFYGAAEKVLGADYRELRSKAYSPHFILAATEKSIKERPKVLQAFLGALVKADAIVKADPDAAQRTVLKNLKAAMPKEVLAKMWTDVEFGTVLNTELLNLLKAQAAWIIERGVIKTKMPSDAAFRDIFVDAPLRAVAPGNVALP